MADHFDVVIVGAGQSGLAISHQLAQRKIDHIVLERRRIAERWRTERWDSLAFQMPNWSLELPGKAYDGDVPEAFAKHDEILRFIEAYAVEQSIPVQTDTDVLALRRDGAAGYLLETSRGDVCAGRVVIATGPFHLPAIPQFAAALPSSIVQSDPVRYKSPEQFPPGAVLVVGSGSSGTQVADELLRAGRSVFLSIGRHRYAPRRYRDRDVIWWLDALGRFDVTIDQFPDRKYPPPTVMTGVDGGYDLYPRLLLERGAVLLGRILSCADGVLSLAGDVNTVLSGADKSCREFIAAADLLAEQMGLGGESASWVPSPPKEVPIIPQLDLSEAGVSTVVWATGYRSDYSWVHLPVFDGRGIPVQIRGITDCSGLYFLGLHWMHTFGSGLLSYVGRDAAHVVDHIARGKGRM